MTSPGSPPPGGERQAKEPLPGTTFNAWFPDLFDHDHPIWDRLADAVHGIADEFALEVHFGSETHGPEGDIAGARIVASWGQP